MPTKKGTFYFFLMPLVFAKAISLPVSELMILTSLELLICVYFLSTFTEEDQHVGDDF